MTSEKSYITEARLTALVDGVDTWHNLGSLLTGWSVTLAQYKAIGVAGLVIVKIRNLVPLTTTPDATAIWSAANGLPASWRPADNTRLPAYSGAGAGSHQPALEFETDGSIQNFGTSGTTIARMDGLFLLSAI